MVVLSEGRGHNMTTKVVLSDLRMGQQGLSAICNYANGGAIFAIFIHIRVGKMHERLG